MSKTSSERRRNYLHIKHMQSDMGLERADILAYAGHKYGFDNGGLESISVLSDDDLDDLIASMSAYLDFHRIMVSDPQKALGLAKRIVKAYSYTPLVDPSSPKDASSEELDAS